MKDEQAVRFLISFFIISALAYSFAMEYERTKPYETE